MWKTFQIPLACKILVKWGFCSRSLLLLQTVKMTPCTGLLNLNLHKMINPYKMHCVIGIKSTGEQVNMRTKHRTLGLFEHRAYWPEEKHWTWCTIKHPWFSYRSTEILSYWSPLFPYKLFEMLYFYKNFYFVILYFVAFDALLAGRLVLFKWNQAWHSSEVIGA